MRVESMAKATGAVPPVEAASAITPPPAVAET